MKVLKIFIILFLIPISLSAVKLMAIYQQNVGTILHQISIIDSLSFSQNADSLIIHKPGKLVEYNVNLIDSIRYVDGGAWSDSISACLDVTSVGVVGDAVTDNTTTLDNAILKAQTLGLNLYFPNGTYLYNKANMSATNVRFIGQSMDGTVIKESVMREHNIEGADNITFQDFVITDKNTSLPRIFKNCRFKITLPVTDSYYIFITGKYVKGADLEFSNCDFVFPKIYIALYLQNYNSVLVKNCTFNSNALGSAWHNIYVAAPTKFGAQIKITDNTITGGTTGIFIGGNQIMPTVGGLVENNQVNGQQEESISIDGFGNNASLIPVIANGTIYSAQNDSLGRLVMSLKGMTLNGSTAATVSARNDWSNFYFCFGQNSGMEGAFVKIVGVNAAANTVTLDTIVASSAIKNGGNAGVESGAFYWTIRNNRVSNTLGANNTYGTALSIYLNVFGTLVENNTVTNCAHGINVAGGIMINGLNTLAYHNIVRNNTFTNCDKYGSGNPSEDIGVIRFVSYWGTGPLQYNNQFVNNTVNGGRVFIERQRNFVETGNTYNNVTRLAIDVQ